MATTLVHATWISPMPGPEFYHVRRPSTSDGSGGGQEKDPGKVTRSCSGVSKFIPYRYGAIEYGFHKFHNNQVGTESHAGRFTVIWNII